MSKITALMSVYNEENNIEETISSILNQSFTDFEFIIVNDGSTDKTEEIIRMFDDKRIRYFSFEENQGVGAALHFGLSKARGEYIAKVDADDISRIDRFEMQLNYLLSNPYIDLVHSYVNYLSNEVSVLNSQRFKHLQSTYLNQIKRLSTPKDFSIAINWFCCIIHSTMMVRSHVATSISYSSDFRTGEDYDFFYRLNKLGCKIDIIPEPLVDVRVSLQSTSVIETDMYVDIIYKIKTEDISEFLLNNSYQYLIWGTGLFGETLFKKLRQRDYSIFGFIDSDRGKWDTQRCGLNTYSPSILRKGKHKVIVASTTGRLEIVEVLKGQNFSFKEDFFVF